MATGGEEQSGYSLVRVRTLTLERNTDASPYYISIVICQDKIIVVDNKDKVKIHRLQNGRFLEMLDSEFPPRYVCLLDTITICVLHYDGLIEIVSIKSDDNSPVFTKSQSLRLHGFLLERYHCVVSVNDNIIVVGEKKGTIYWCNVSIGNGHVNKIQLVCKGSIWSDVKVKDNMIYVSSCAGVTSTNTGVYGFDFVTHSQRRYTYTHQRLQKPTAIVINEDGNIFVGNFGVQVDDGVFQDACIHQLTASCQLVAIFTQGIPNCITAMCWDQGRMYVTCDRSREITVFRHVYQGSHKASDVLVNDERKLPGIQEEAIQISQGNIDNGQLSVETERPSSGTTPENNEDETHGNYDDSAVQISDEERRPVMEETSTQMGQDVVDNGQLNVEAERFTSGSSPENNEDEKDGKLKDSEVPISDEERQPVLEGISSMIVEDIVDNEQLSVETDRPPHGSSPENSEDDILDMIPFDAAKDRSFCCEVIGAEPMLKQGNHTDSEVSISDEERQLVIDGASTQIGQNIVDNEQLCVETERPPSGSDPENNEDEKHGTPSSNNTGIAADLLHPVQDVRTMTDDGRSRQTVDTAVQCDIIQIRL